MSVAEHFHSVTPEVPLAFANRANAPQSTLDGAVINTASADGTNATQTEATSHDQSNSSMSKYLVLPSSSTAAPKALPRARLLTSAECLSQLEEKERQKRLAIKEKGQRKRKKRNEKRKKPRENKNENRKLKKEQRGLKEG